VHGECQPFMAARPARRRSMVRRAPIAVEIRRNVLRRVARVAARGIVLACVGAVLASRSAMRRERERSGEGAPRKWMTCLAILGLLASACDDGAGAPAGDADDDASPTSHVDAASLRDGGSALDATSTQDAGPRDAAPRDASVRDARSPKDANAAVDADDPDFDAAPVVIPDSHSPGDARAPYTEYGGAACADCHGDKLQGNPWSDPPAPSCYSCHNSNDHTVARSDRTGPNVMHRSGSESSCANCHGPNNAGGLGRACHTCHANR
jgi:hypothetical protein